MTKNDLCVFLLAILGIPAACALVVRPAPAAAHTCPTLEAAFQEDLAVMKMCHETLNCDISLSDIRELRRKQRAAAVACGRTK